MNLLAAPPPSMTPAQRGLLWITAIVVAASRLWAASRTMWDWDELQFALALREYDVGLHQPHPPGFPLFVGLANVFDLAFPEFAALQVVVVASACTLFPLIFLLSRELRFPFATAYSGALLFAFFPNVWFFGGTGFSDVPGLALLLGACVLLLRGCRDRRSYYAGAIVLGLAAGVRPQALLVACAPALIASWHRVRRDSWRSLAAASLIGAAVLAVCYAVAAFATSSVDAYLESVAGLRSYVREIDSFMSPGRPPLAELFPSFFITVVPGGTTVKVIVALALVAVVLAAVLSLVSLRRTSPRYEGVASVWLLLLMFLPFNVFGWLMLDVHSVTRYSVGYVAMYAVLAAQAVVWLAAVTRRAAPAVAIVTISVLAGRLAFWGAPAMNEARNTGSPPMQAMEWADRTFGPDTHFYVHGSVGPHARYSLANRSMTPFDALDELQLSAAGNNEWVLTEGTVNCISAKHFVRERGRLYEIVRKRYFEVTVMPRGCLASHGEGWYGDEWVGASAWRWMGARSEMKLSPVASPARLQLRMGVPQEVRARQATVTIWMNGTLVERFKPSADTFDRSWTVASRGEGWNDLVIEIDRTVNPQKEGLFADGRDLGLQLTGYGWEGVRRVKSEE